MNEKVEQIRMLASAARQALMARGVGIVTEGVRLLQVLSEHALQAVLDGRVKPLSFVLGPLMRYAGLRREERAAFVCAPAGPDRPVRKPPCCGEPAAADPPAGIAAEPAPDTGAPPGPETPPAARKRRAPAARDRSRAEPRPRKRPSGTASRPRKSARAKEPPDGGDSGAIG